MDDLINTEDNATSSKLVKVKNSDRVPVEVLTTKKFEQLLKADNLPFLPNVHGYCNVKAVKNAITGFELTGTNQLIAKVFLHEQGRDNDNILTFKQAHDLKTSIRAGENGFYLSYYDKKKNSKVITRYFAGGQTTLPDMLPYQSVKSESDKGLFVQESADAQNYISNYLQCVAENRPFTAPPEVVAQFKENFAKELAKSPIQLYKMGDLAAKHVYIQTEKGKQWLKTDNGKAFLKSQGDNAAAFIQPAKSETLRQNKVQQIER